MAATQTQLDQVERCAVGILHMLLGKATLEFPTSTQAHPSFQVTVLLISNGALWPAAGNQFPFQMRWDIWENVAVPVLLDEANQFFPDNGASRNHLMLALLDMDLPTEALTKVQEVLVDAMKVAGYMPEDPADPNPVVVPVAAGEPITREPEISQQQAETSAGEGTVYSRLDADDEPPVYTQFDVG